MDRAGANAVKANPTRRVSCQSEAASADGRRMSLILTMASQRRINFLLHKTLIQPTYKPVLAPLSPKVSFNFTQLVGKTTAAALDRSSQK